MSVPERYVYNFSAPQSVLHDQRDGFGCGSRSAGHFLATNHAVLTDLLARLAVAMHLNAAEIAFQRGKTTCYLARDDFAWWWSPPSDNHGWVGKENVEFLRDSYGLKADVISVLISDLSVAKDPFIRAVLRISFCK